MLATELNCSNGAIIVSAVSRADCSLLVARGDESCSSNASDIMPTKSENYNYLVWIVGQRVACNGTLRKQFGAASAATSEDVVKQHGAFHVICGLGRLVLGLLNEHQNEIVDVDGNVTYLTCSG